ncbi:MAG: FG-GAP repeat domain-containing protein [Adhaeribacter sp.]
MSSRKVAEFLPGRWLAALALLCLLAQCRQEKKNVESPGAARLAEVLPKGSTAHLSGRQLAQAYCQACHLFPEPALLDKQAWEKGVLPNMALRLGLGDFLDNPYGGMDVEEILAVQQAGAFADSPLVSSQDWEKIVAYYLAEAPAKALPPPARAPLRTGLPLFEEAQLPDSLALSQMITLVKIDGPRRRLFVGDQQNHLFVLGPDFRTRQVLNLESPPTDVLPGADGSFRVVTIGVLPPSDRTVGGVWAFRPVAGKAGYQPQQVLAKRKRPVQMAEADLDADGLPDLVLAEHGHHTGKVSWYQNRGQGKYAEKLLKTGPGARQVIVRDMNQDQKPDVLVLAGQGQEGVYLLLNQGRGRFAEQTLLRFPPVYGSSYLETGDFNGDGFTDLVYANGDNADFSFSLKAYHGLRIFLNDGKNNFKEAWFFPLHGATKVLPVDFDQDGDLDLAAIAFFSDFSRQPSESFVYLENKGGLRFGGATFANSGTGHWLTLDTGDLDQDGDADLVLGSSLQTPAYVPPSIRATWFSSGVQIKVLRNKLKERGR